MIFRYAYSRSIYSVGAEKEGSKSAFAEANWQLASTLIDRFIPFIVRVRN